MIISGRLSGRNLPQNLPSVELDLSSSGVSPAKLLATDDVRVDEPGDLFRFRTSRTAIVSGRFI
jgi:hypothetical protein